VKIIHVGSGALGLLLAYKAEQQLNNYSLICDENLNDFIGRTWYENKYPGCACDVPTLTYTYTVETNSENSNFYSYSEEVQTYFERFQEKDKMAKYIHLNTEV
ncbi:uncharacterized protein A1O9_12981, partial [Exophiala aquamarina CBS 119918]